MREDTAKALSILGGEKPFYSVDLTGAEVATLHRTLTALDRALGDAVLRLRRVADLTAELADSEKMRELHADLNRRTAAALRKPAFGDGSSWHDIPEIVKVLADLAALRVFAPTTEIMRLLPLAKRVTIKLT